MSADVCLTAEALEALATYRRQCVDEPSDIASCLANHALCLLALGREGEAMAEAARTLEIAERSLPDDHPTRLKCEEVVAELDGRGPAEEE